MPQNLALCTARLLIPQQEALEETSKTADELREQILAAQQSATADASKVAEAHALELQRLQVERTKLEVRLTQDTALCPAHLPSLSFNRQHAQAHAPASVTSPRSRQRPNECM